MTRPVALILFVLCCLLAACGEPPDDPARAEAVRAILVRAYPEMQDKATIRVPKTAAAKAQARTALDRTAATGPQGQDICFKLYTAAMSRSAASLDLNGAEVYDRDGKLAVYRWGDMAACQVWASS
jgi:hypothetical protein